MAATVRFALPVSGGVSSSLGPMVMRGQPAKSRLQHRIEIIGSGGKRLGCGVTCTQHSLAREATRISNIAGNWESLSADVYRPGRTRGTVLVRRRSHVCKRGAYVFPDPLEHEHGHQTAAMG